MSSPSAPPNPTTNTPDAPAAPTPAPAGPAKLPFPPITEQHILNCAYPSWYTLFPHLAIRTLILPIPPAFLSYLNEDGIVLPDDNPAPPPQDIDSDYFSAENTDDSDSDASDDTIQEPDPTALFPEFHAQVTNCISQLGGKVSVKLDWSAPQDSTFILPNNSGECRTASDIYLLLKSSGLVSFDLGDPYKECTKEHGTVSEEAKGMRHLVLRKWTEVTPALEFRAYVKEGKVVGICQRDENYYDYVHKMEDEIKDKILDLYDDHLSKTFPDSTFTFDVYVDTLNKKTFLIDINAFAPFTDPLLFSWHELLEMDPDIIDEPQLRLVNKDDPEAWSYSSSKWSSYKMPLDVVDAGSGGMHSIQAFAENWKNIVNGVENLGH